MSALYDLSEDLYALKYQRKVEHQHWETKVSSPFLHEEIHIHFGMN